MSIKDNVLTNHESLNEQTAAILADGKENRNITMHISVFCGASHPCAVKMQK